MDCKQNKTIVYKSLKIVSRPFQDQGLINISRKTINKNRKEIDSIVQIIERPTKFIFGQVQVHGFGFDMVIVENLLFFTDLLFPEFKGSLYTFDLERFSMACLYVHDAKDETLGNSLDVTKQGSDFRVTLRGFTRTNVSKIEKTLVFSEKKILESLK